jgi:DNA-nicking Smr family endonuclease
MMDEFTSKKFNFEEFFKNDPVDRLDLMKMDLNEAIEKLRIRYKAVKEKNYRKLFIMTGFNKEDVKSAVLQFAVERKIKHYLSEYNADCVVMVVKPAKSFLRKFLDVMFFGNVFNVGLFFMILKYKLEKKM